MIDWMKQARGVVIEKTLTLPPLQTSLNPKSVGDALIEVEESCAPDSESPPLNDLAEAREERAAILEFDQGFTRAQAEKKAARKTHFVTCGSCLHWEGNSPCGAGMVTSGDPIPGIAVRLCGFHTERTS